MTELGRVANYCDFSENQRQIAAGRGITLRRPEVYAGRTGPTTFSGKKAWLRGMVVSSWK